MSDSGVLKSVSSAIERMSVQELAALIKLADQKRREKLELAKQELVIEFQGKAAELGLSIEALFPQQTTQKTLDKPHGKPKPKGQAKFRGPNGEEWSGRGRLPKWLTAFETDGRTRDEFAVTGK